jgi:hypothetical protein
VVNVSHPHKSAQFDLSVLEKHLPSRERKMLLSQVKALADTTLPEPDDLSPFWLAAEEALRGLHPDLDNT